MSNVAPSQTPLTSLLTSLMTQAIELHNRGEIRAAIELYRRVFDAQPGHFDALHLMGVATYQLGDLTLAEKVIGAALAIRPESAEAHNNLGSIHVDRQQYGEAMQCYLQALQHRPDYAEAYANLGNVLLSMERVEEAGACHEQALRLQPDFVPALVGLARTHFALRDLPSAARCLERGLAIAPDAPELLTNLAMVIVERGLPEQALPVLDRVAANPVTDATATDLRQLALARMQPDPMARDRLFHGGLIADAEALARADLAMSNTVDHHNFLLKCMLASPHHDAHAYFDESRRWSKAHAGEHLLPEPSSFANDRDPQRRLNVAIVGDYFDSVIGKYTLYPFFRQYDRERIRLFCYNFGGGSAEIAPIVDVHRDVTGIGDERFFDLVRADRIDILLDINGRLRAPNFLGAILRQPAPIQVNWYNLTATVGARAYNYLIADDYSVPPQDAPLYVEKIFNMPNGTISSWDIGAPPKVPGPPLERLGHPTFGCFGDFFKVNDYVLQTWARLLRKVDNAKLYLKSNNLRVLAERERIAERFAQLGVGPERLILEGPSPYPIMKRLYELVDVAIDTFPYSSGSSSINALWQGVPVVAIGGDDWRSRNTASILVGAGLTGYIASDVDDYLARAQALAGDIDHLRMQRRQLAEYLQTTPQWQTADFAVNFESRLRAIWHDWLQQAAR